MLSYTRDPLPPVAVRVPDEPQESRAGLILSEISCILGILSFFFLTLLFGLAGLVIGIVGACMCKDSSTAAIGIVLSLASLVVLFAFWGL